MVQKTGWHIDCHPWDLFFDSSFSLTGINDKDLWDLHLKLMGILTGINRAKVKKIKNIKMAKADYYPCVFCLKHFGKLDWLKKMDPQNEWIVEDIEG